MTRPADRSVLVLVETQAGGVREVSLEAVTFARRLAEQRGGQPVDAAVVGPLSDEVQADLLAQLGEHGVRTVRVAEHESLGTYGASAWAAALVEAAQSAASAAVVASGTPRGCEVLAHVAVRLDVAMAANAVEVVSADPLVVARQVVGGAVLEEMGLPDSVAVLAVAGHACDPEPAARATSPEVIRYTPTLSDADLVGRVARTEPAPADDSAALTSALVVVGAGRGVGSADGFDGVVELTERLGGALGVSRVVTSLGWRPHHEQVGQTGSRIAPDLYVACGISGAIQHWAGCQSAKTILAINTDPDAPMVTRAHYAVLGDLHEIVPAINEELARRAG